jgi:hemerythrin
MTQESAGLDTGIQIIDSSYIKLSGRLNSLRAAIRNMVCRYTIDDAIAYLEEYAIVHFWQEEEYMKRFNYPAYHAHRKAHEHFFEELHFLREELQNIRSAGLNGSYELSVETVQLVTDWISGHVRMDDKALGTFLCQLKCVDHEVGALSLM